MSFLAEVMALVLLSITLPGTLYLLLLSLAGSLPVRSKNSPGMMGAIAVVVPAHNEAAGIRRTVENLLALATHDGATSVIVIADNCTDATAEIAHKCGARVLERHDLSHCGKGYALDFAFHHLLKEDFVAFAVADADSLAEANFISSLRKHFGAGALSLQTRYTVLNPGDNTRTRLAEIALAAFNVLRPRGRDRLGLSVGILGNGFALRREVLQQVPYTATSVVEDLEYHLKLIANGYRVEFANDTCIYGEMPGGKQGQNTQHARWQGGRLRMLIEHGPVLASKVLWGQSRFIEPLADLLLLPLAYHVLILCMSLLLSLVQPSPVTAFVALGSLAVIFLHIMLAFHSSHLPWQRLSILIHIPAYLISKIRMIATTLSAARRGSTWVRTNRTGS